MTFHQRLAHALLALAILSTGAAQAQAQADTDTQTDTQTGRISYYSTRFAGRPTASGERFDPNAMTMAHKTLPFGSEVRVTHLGNRRSVVLRVNDRGPWSTGRVADITPAAARALRMTKHGVATATLSVLKRGRG